MAKVLHVVCQLPYASCGDEQQLNCCNDDLPHVQCKSDLVKTWMAVCCGWQKKQSEVQQGRGRDRHGEGGGCLGVHGGGGGGGGVRREGRRFDSRRQQ